MLRILKHTLNNIFFAKIFHLFPDTYFIYDSTGPLEFLLQKLYSEINAFEITKRKY